MHWTLCWDRLDKEVVDGAVSNCQCLLLSFEELLSKESGCEGFRHLSPCSLEQSIYYQVIDQAAQYNQHRQS